MKAMLGMLIAIFTMSGTAFFLAKQPHWRFCTAGCLICAWALVWRLWTYARPHSPRPPMCGRPRIPLEKR